MTRLGFWAAAATIAWTYIGFPIVVAIRALVRPRPVLAAPITPRVSVVMAARNEEAVIADKLRNLIASTYPPDCYEIVLASDGSTDGTVREASPFLSARVRILDLPAVGKADALNAAVEASTGEVLVFTDANSMFEADAIARLVRPLADPTVGGVAGDQRYLAAGADDRAGGERRYWAFDRWMKVAESAGGNAIGATGAIYAIRRELFEPVITGVTDDFYTSTAVIDRGRRLVFAEDAVAWEPPAPGNRREWERKVRIITRGLRGVVARRCLLDPRRTGFYALQLLTHKVLRRLTAVPLAVLAVTSLPLATRGPLYALAAVGQAGLYGLGAVGLVFQRERWAHSRIFSLPAFFMLVNAAALRAMANLVTGRRIERWDPRRGGGSS